MNIFLLLLLFLLAGIWIKHQNRKHIRKMHQDALNAEYAAVKKEAEAMTKPLGFKPGVFNVEKKKR